MQETRRQSMAVPRQAASTSELALGDRRLEHARLILMTSMFAGLALAIPATTGSTGSRICHTAKAYARSFFGIHSW